MKKQSTDEMVKAAGKRPGNRAAFDWWLFAFIAFVIILLVTLLSIT